MYINIYIYRELTREGAENSTRSETCDEEDAYFLLQEKRKKLSCILFMNPKTAIQRIVFP